MSLLLSGAKTITFAGTEMQCLEIYTGEAYTIGLNFTDAGGTPIDISAWTLTTDVKYYSVDTVTYDDDLGQINLGNIVEDSPQGTAPSGLAVTVVSAVGGTAALYVPDNLTDGASNRPTVQLVNGKADPTTLAIISVNISRADTTVPANINYSREPLGFIVRYQ
tara:strand:+ start:3138 stop:3629 length:492 start_codon:yes stop_codon:yes gene_type:complete